MQTRDALSIVFARNSFYRRQYLLALGAFVLTLIVVGVLSWIFYYLIKNPTKPLYFATDDVGRLIDIIPVDKPNMNIDDVIAWTNEAVEAAYAYDYINYHGQLQSAQKYFTTYGWMQYMSALQLSNNLLALTQRRQIVLAQIVERPKILAEGILGGAYAWKFQMPVLITYWEPPYDDKSKFYNPLTVTVVVQRQPILKGYKGLGVVQIIANITSSGSQQPQELTAPPTS